MPMSMSTGPRVPCRECPLRGVAELKHQEGTTSLLFGIMAAAAEARIDTGELFSGDGAPTPIDLQRWIASYENTHPGSPLPTRLVATVSRLAILDEMISGAFNSSSTTCNNHTGEGQKCPNFKADEDGTVVVIS